MNDVKARIYKLQGRDNPRFIFYFLFLFNKHRRKRILRIKKIIASQKIRCWNCDKHNDYATQSCKDGNHGTSSRLTRGSGVMLRKISDCQLLLTLTLLFVYVSPRHFYTPVSARRWVPMVIKKCLMSYTVLVQSPNRVF